MRNLWSWSNHGRFIQRMIVVLMIVGILVTIVTGVMTADSLETSIVSLVICSTDDQILENDYFFELLDFGDYLLLPVGMLTSPLAVELNFQREAGLLRLSSSQTGKTVEIAVEEQIYLGHEEWSQEPPLMLQGEFYVTPRLLEYLTGVTIQWNSKLQELTIKGVAESTENLNQPDSDQSAQQFDQQESGHESVSPEPQGMGDQITLSSVQYQVQMELRKKGDNPLGMTKYEDVGLYGRWWDWSFSAEGRKSQIMATEDVSYELTNLLAQTQTDTGQLTVGDTEVDLDQTIGQQKIRGVVYHDKSYKQRGDSRGILEQGDRQGMWTLGLYRETTSHDWAGQLVGFDLAQGVAQNLTLNWQLAVNRWIDGQVPKQKGSAGLRVGSVLGVVVGWPWPVVTTVDWLVGGDGQSLEDGGKTSLRYTFDSGYVEGGYAVIPPQLTATLQETAGKRYQTVAEWRLDPVLLHFQSEIYRSGWKMNPEGKETALFSITHQPDPWQVTSFTGNVGRSTFKVDLDDSITQGKEEQENILLKDGGVKLKYRREAIASSIQGELSFLVERLFRDDEDTSIYDRLRLNLDGGFYRKWGNWALGSNLSYAGAEQSDGAENELELETRAKWLGPNDLYFSSTGKFQAGQEPKVNGVFSLSELEWNLRLQKYFTHQTWCSMEGNLNKLPFWDKVFFKYTATFSQRSVDDRRGLNLSLGYVSPTEGRQIPQWTWSMNWTQYLNNEVGLKLQVQRNFSSLYEKEPEQVYTISISHRLGRVNDTWLGQRYLDQAEPSPYIGGVVYLDENGDGQMEDGEATIEGIQIFLDGRRAVSDADGLFQFEEVQPGVYEIGFDLNVLDADYTVVTGNKLVQVRENENLFLQFGLTMGGSLTGEVFIDKNANGRREPDEESLPWVRIELVEVEKRTFSRQDGMYYFENIPLGQYTLRVLPDSLPVEMRVGAGFQPVFEIKRNQLDLEKVDIPIVYDF